MGNSCGGGSVGGQDLVVPGTMGVTSFKLGWLKDTPDARDRVLVISEEKKRGLPTSVDLRPKENFAIYNQGGIGSCTANAICACYHFALVQQKPDSDFHPSRLFVYYNERVMEGSVDKDAGATNRSGMIVLKTIGVCSEKNGMWPYIESKFAVKPSANCYTEAYKHRSQEYARVPHTLNDMKACLNGGFPFVFGMIVYSSFMSSSVASSGNMTMPTTYDEQRGGHAVLAVGYDDARKVFIVRNSWGQAWGDKGYFYMPYDYITNSSFIMDLWTVSFVSTQRAFFPTTAIAP